MNDNSDPIEVSVVTGLTRDELRKDLGEEMDRHEEYLEQLMENEILERFRHLVSEDRHTALEAFKVDLKKDMKQMLLDVLRWQEGGK